MKGEYIISLIIPTYNRPDAIFKCIDSILLSSYPLNLIELIIINDGGKDDGYREKISDMTKNKFFAFGYYEIHNSGPAAARNVGIKNSGGEILLFLGDDIMVDKFAIETHAKYHRLNPCAEFGLLGRITWHKEIKVTPFMHWLENGGPQFDYNSLKDENYTDFWHFYGSNVSVKKKFLTENDLLFDERFKSPDYFFEDIEFGYRLMKKGFRLMYSQKALGYHYHPIKALKYAKRIYFSGRSRVLFDIATGKNKNMDVNLFKILYLYLKAGLFLLITLIIERFLYWPYAFSKFSDSFFYIGIIRGKK